MAHTSTAIPQGSPPPTPHVPPKLQLFLTKGTGTGHFQDSAHYSVSHLIEAAQVLSTLGPSSLHLLQLQLSH